MRDADEWARRFEAHRGRLRAVAYRMLGSAIDVVSAPDRLRRLTIAPAP